MSRSWLWKLLLGIGLVLVPGSLLLLPFVVVALQRQRAGRQIVLMQPAAPDEAGPARLEV